MMNISIKNVTIHDAKKLLNIQKQAFKPLYSIYHDKASPYRHDLEDIKQRINRENSDYYKILCDEKLCGGLCVYKMPDDYFWLAIIYIKPDFQNRKIAKSAIKLALDKYPNAKTWGLDFPVDQEKNRRCYESAGFNDTGKQEGISEKLVLALYEKKMI